MLTLAHPSLISRLILVWYMSNSITILQAPFLLHSWNRVSSEPTPYSAQRLSMKSISSNGEVSANVLSSTASGNSRRKQKSSLKYFQFTSAIESIQNLYSLVPKCLGE